MRIAFFVNDINSEDSVYTTTHLAMYAQNMGHDVWYIGAEDFALDPDDRVCARARAAPKRHYKSTRVFLGDIQGRKARAERISADDLDILFLRNNPADDRGPLVWRRHVGIFFGRIAVRRGVIVLNDPNGLSKAMNKMYFQHFPEEVRPTTLITRDPGEIKSFARQYGTIVLKPVMGSGGRDVFLVRPEDLPNLNQMIDAISRDGYIIAQEYLREAERGDTRLFLINGLPFRHKGRYAAFRRVRTGGDMRSNITAGGTYAPAEIGERELRVAEIVRPKIVLDGMFMVGLDIVGDKLMEINVFSPGGLEDAHKLEGVNFSRQVIRVLDRKVDYVRYYRRKFDNVEIATL